MNETDLESTQRVSIVLDALKRGQLQVRPEDGWWVREIQLLKRRATGLLDIRCLSPEALRMARMVAIAVQVNRQHPGPSDKSDDLSGVAGLEIQRTLFGHFESLFRAIVGTASEKPQSSIELRDRMLVRVKHSHDEFARSINSAAEVLRDFYNTNSRSLFTTAQSFGGMKVVIGGQRRFGPSALSATRISGLYCDTQLIPDPVYPFLAGDLHLNALHLQLAIVLFHLLPLRPLIDASISPPPIWVFPSFEEPLEEGDAVTQAGLADLALRIVAPICNAKIDSLEELISFVRLHEQDFLDAVFREGLFVPPGGDPSKRWNVTDAVKQYLEDAKGVRNEKLVQMMRSAPHGTLVLNGILERL